MWLFTSFGFFSTVRKHGDDHLTIRARVAADLDRLRVFLPTLSATRDTPANDYPYRATAGHEEFASALARIAMGIDYDNFKAAVAAQMSHGRSTIYGRVWQVLRELEAENCKPAAPAAMPKKARPRRRKTP